MKTASYKNRKLEFEESDTPKLRINGDAVPIGRDPEARVFFADELPYRSFESLKTLAEAVVDHRASGQ